MRLLKLLLLLAILSPCARATVTQTATCNNNGASGAACSITVQPNQVIVMMGTAFGAYTTFDANGWWCQNGNLRFSQSYVDPNNSGFRVSTGISACVTGSHSGTDTFTVGETQFNVGASIVITQWSGLANANNNNVATVDSSVGTTATAASSGTISGGNLTTTVSGDLLLVIGSAAGNAQSLTVGASYTSDAGFNYTESIGTFVGVLAEHQIAGAAGSYAANMSTSASGVWAIVGIALSPSTSNVLVL